MFKGTHESIDTHFRDQWFSNGGAHAPRGTVEYCRATPGKKLIIIIKNIKSGKCDKDKENP